MFNPLYAHLARDPKPAHLMKTTAPYVWNRVERLNRPEQLQEHTIDNPAINSLSGEMFTGETLPETLTKLMTYIGEEYAAEFAAHIDFADGWLAEQSDDPETIKAPLGRGIGFAGFNWRGHDIKTAVMPYRFYLAQRLWDHVDGCNEADQTTIRNLFGGCGLEAFLDKRPIRRVIRKDYNEVWA